MLAVPVGKEGNDIIMTTTQALNLRRTEAKKTGLQNGGPRPPHLRSGSRRPLAEYLDKFAGLPVVSREMVQPAKI